MVRYEYKDENFRGAARVNHTAQKILMRRLLGRGSATTIAYPL